MPVPSYGRSPREQSNRESRKNLKGLVRDNLHACIGLSTCEINANGSKLDSKADPSYENCSNGAFWASCEGKCIEANDWPVKVGDSRIESAASRRRQSRILDRWAARQARDMITTIERQACEAELQALSSTHPVSTLASSFMRESSPSRSECSVELPNLRASSLVQMWRELEAEATMSVDNRTSSVNSPGSATTNAASIGDQGSINEEQSEYESDERNESPKAPDDMVSDSGESERGRVSDLVRRLNSGYRTTSSLTSYSDENERESPPGARGQSQFDSRGNSGFCSNGSLHLIRGRQATRDLFVRIGRDRERELARLVERRTVSHFSHRSRIQALLRFRLLQREVAIPERPSHTSTASELDELQHRTSISILRERFSPRSESDICSPAFSSGSSRRRQLPLNSAYSENSGVSEQLSNENVDDQETPTREHDQEGRQLTPLSVPSTSEYWPESSPSPDCIGNERRFSVHDLDLQAPMATSSQGVTEETDSKARQQHRTMNAMSVEPNSNTQQHVEVGHSDGTWSTNVPNPQRGGNSEAICHNWLESISNNEEEHAVTVEPEPDTQQRVGEVHTDATWSTHDSHTQRVGNDNEEAMYQDWLESISDNEEGDAVTEEQEPGPAQDVGVGFIQRARSGRYEALYHDWLERISDNEEMLALLARSVVSSTLASDFRVRMDRLMSSHLQVQDNQFILEEDGNAGVEENSPQLPLPSRFSDLQESPHSASLVASPSTQLPLPSRFFDYLDSPQQNSSFIYNEEQNSPNNVNEVASTSFQLQLPSQLLQQQGDQQPTSPLLRDDEARNANQVESASIQTPLQSQLLDRESSPQQNSSHPSLEMELIYDLREDMLRLHQDMCELRRSLENSINMQVQLQRSIKQEVSSASSDSAESSKRLKSSTWALSRKGSCCICYEMQIDSLLYRCGHMCTCYKCAYELQWSSGICPICRAPIVDVVRTYSDT